MKKNRFFFGELKVLPTFTVMNNSNTPTGYEQYLSDYADYTLTEISEYVERARQTLNHHRTHPHLYTNAQLTQLPLRLAAAKMTKKSIYEANGWDATCI